MERCGYRSEITAKPGEKCGCWPLRKLQGKESGLLWNLPTPQFSPSETRVRLQNYRRATCVVETTKKEVIGYRSKWKTNTGTVGSSQTTTLLGTAASQPTDPQTRAFGLRCSSEPSPETKHRWQSSHGCDSVTDSARSTHHVVEQPMCFSVWISQVRSYGLGAGYFLPDRWKRQTPRTLHDLLMTIKETEVTGQ